MRCWWRAPRWKAYALSAVLMTFSGVILIASPVTATSIEESVWGWLGIIGVAFAAAIGAAWLIEKRFRSWAKEEAQRVTYEHDSDHRAHDGAMQKEFAKWRAENAGENMRREDEYREEFRAHKDDPRAHPDAFERHQELIKDLLDKDRERRALDNREFLQQIGALLAERKS